MQEKATFSVVSPKKNVNGIVKDGKGSSVLVIKRSKPRDPERLAPHLRKEDADECYAACGHSPLEALQVSYKVSQECYSGFFQGDLKFLFGVVPVSPKIGAIWLLCADLTMPQSVEILRAAPGYLDRFERLYPTITNVVDARNVLHLKWLEHLGFTIGELIPQHGYECRPFYSFYRGVPFAMQPHLSQPA